jgi:hypothetical protein
MAYQQLAAVDLGQGLSDAWGVVARFVPGLVAFLVILLIGWLVAKAVAKAVRFALEKVRFDRLVEHGGLKQMLARNDLDAGQIIAKLVYYAILLIALQLAFGVWGPNPVSDLLTAIVAWLPKAIVAIIIVVIAGAIARVVRDLVSSTLGGLSYGRTLGTIASVFVWGLGVIAALNQVEIATTVTTPVLIAILATLAGVAIVGVGGGLVRPMQSRWEIWLDRAEHEIPAARQDLDQHRHRATAMSGATPNPGTTARPDYVPSPAPPGPAPTPSVARRSDTPEQEPPTTPTETNRDKRY